MRQTSKISCVSKKGKRPSPVLLWLGLSFHGGEEGWRQLTLFSHLQTRVAHFDVDDGEILHKNSNISSLAAKLYNKSNQFGITITTMCTLKHMRQT